jgi:hypothetical protein
MEGFYYGHSGCVEILTTLFDFLEHICCVMVCYETSQFIPIFQIVDHIGGIQEPVHSTSHITCLDDDVLGKRIKFTIHRN